jgi:hypothetical protein
MPAPQARARNEKAHAFYFQFTECGGKPRLDLGREFGPTFDRTGKLTRAMLNWLTDNIELFGLPVQNWMLLLGGGLLLYIAILAWPRRRRSGPR